MLAANRAINLFDFYPRPPRGGRRLTQALTPPVWNFYPRPPRGGRRPAIPQDPLPDQISIHALREEGDCVCMVIYSHSKDFYPRPPRGGRRFASDGVVTLTKFLSTPSARRATLLKLTPDGLFGISIHALREEGDLPIRSIFDGVF